MSVRLLGLKDGRIALSHGRKRSESESPCYLRFSLGDPVALAICARGKGQGHLPETDLVWFRLKDLHAGGTWMDGQPVVPPAPAQHKS